MLRQLLEQKLGPITTPQFGSTANGTSNRGGNQMITMKKGPEYGALENEALNALVTEMQSLREEVIILREEVIIWKQILKDR